MFAMFVIGGLFGAAMLASYLSLRSQKPNPFNLAVLLLLFTLLIGQWAIAAESAKFQGQYDAISGGKGDGL